MVPRLCRSTVLHELPDLLEARLDILGVVGLEGEDRAGAVLPDEPLERVLQNDEESPPMNAKNQKKTRRSGFSAITAEVD